MLPYWWSSSTIRPKRGEGLVRIFDVAAYGIAFPASFLAGLLEVRASEAPVGLIGFHFDGKGGSALLSKLLLATGSDIAEVLCG